MQAQWTEGHYGVYYLYPLKGNRELCVCVCWDSFKPRNDHVSVTGYKVTFAGFTLKARPHSLDEAKTLGVRLARKVLTDALEGVTDEVVPQ